LSLPAGTQPNHLMAMSGYSTIDVSQVPLPDRDLIYDWLTRIGIRRMLHGPGGEQVEDIGLGTVGDLRADHLGVDFRVGYAPPRAADHRVDDLSRDLTCLARHVDFFLALHGAHVLQDGARIDEGGLGQRLLETDDILIEEGSRPLDRRGKADQAELGTIEAAAPDLLGDDRHAAIVANVDDPALDLQIHAGGPVHMGDGVRDDRISGERKDRVRADLPIDLERNFAELGSRLLDHAANATY
jgi:hypothetical protein